MCPEWSSYGIQESCTNYVSTKQTLAHPATSARKWRRWTADVAYGVSLRRCNQSHQRALEIRPGPGLGTRIWPGGNAEGRQGIWLSVVDDAVDGREADVVLLGQIG